MSHSFSPVVRVLALTNSPKFSTEYRTVDRKELIKDGYMAWRSILCETNMTKSRIAGIQRALRDKGYNSILRNYICKRVTPGHLNGSKFFALRIYQKHI